MDAADMAALLPARLIPRKKRLILERALTAFDARLTAGGFTLAPESDDLVCRTAEAIGRAFGQNGVQVRPISLSALIAAALDEERAGTVLTRGKEGPDPLAIQNFGERWLLHGLLVAPNRPITAAETLGEMEATAAWVRLQQGMIGALKSLFPHHSSAFKIEQRVLQNTQDILRAWLLSARLGGVWQKTAVQRVPLIETLSECVVYGSRLHPRVWLVLVA